MKSTLSTVAAGLSFIIGAMAIFAGGQVLLGNLPDYYVIDWLVVYNFTLGIVSAFFTAVMIWKKNKLAMPAAITTLGLHIIVMVLLQTAYRAVVAPDSIRAMTVRMSVWLIILALMLVDQRQVQSQCH